jgi:hypothetical protein
MTISTAERTLVIQLIVRLDEHGDRPSDEEIPHSLERGLTSQIIETMRAATAT